MGGGAGVNFKLNFWGFYFTTPDGKVVPEKTPEIESWECLGYMDGMDNIRGDMLKVTKFDYELTDEDKAYFVERGIESDTEMWCSNFTLENMEWAGWLRGTWQSAFPMILTGTVDLEYIGEVEVAVTVEPTDPDEFNDFWLDVFEFYADDELTDDDGNEISIEEQYEWQNEDNRANYGMQDKKRVRP